eukprot:TCONS_00009719-protein
MTCSCKALITLTFVLSLWTYAHCKNIQRQEVCSKANIKLRTLRERFTDKVRDAWLPAAKISNIDSNEANIHFTSALNYPSNEFPVRTLITPDMLEIYLNAFTALNTIFNKCARKTTDSTIKATLNKLVHHIATVMNEIDIAIKEYKKCLKYQKRQDLLKFIPQPQKANNFVQLKRQLKEKSSKNHSDHQQLINKIIKITIFDMDNITEKFIQELDIKLLDL